MLARVPQARATQDIDLAAGRAADLEAAIQALQDAAGRDLGDHLRFTLTRTVATGLGDNQPDVQTRRAVFTCTDADTGRRIGEIPIDIVVGPPPVGTVETVEPAHRLALPRPLPTHPYQVFPIADQIAEKVCATMYDKYPRGRRSSRVKDLVDLVVITRTQTINLPSDAEWTPQPRQADERASGSGEVWVQPARSRSFGKCPRARTARRYLALIASIIFYSACWQADSTDQRHDGDMPRTKAGRPKSDRPQLGRITMTISGEQVAQFDRIADALDLNRSEALRQAMADWVLANCDAAPVDQESLFTDHRVSA